MGGEQEKTLVEDLIRKARIAQALFEPCSQKQVDTAVRAIAKVVFDHAEPLARMAVDETRMGVYEDKVRKNQGKARVLWNELKGKKSVGVLREIPEEGLVEVAKPMGVVGAVTPTTNPVVTPMCNAMFALKGRNAIVICPHPRAKGCSTETVRLMRGAVAKLGLPEDLIQVIDNPTVVLSGLVMKLCDVCISTGGMGMVRAAYSSGKPAFGVGAGNVQCLIDTGMDAKKVVPMVIEGRRFDNGIICSAEQTAIMPSAEYDSLISEFVRNGCSYVSEPQEIEALQNTLFPGGVMNKDCVGQSAQSIARLAGLEVPAGTRVLVVRRAGAGEDLFAREKMCPVLAAYAYDTWEEGVAIAKRNLEIEGKGHTVCIHSDNREHIGFAAETLSVSRFLINQVCATSNGGSFFNSLAATTTLGCGSWGNNSISENLSWKHLINISRIAFVRPGSRALSDEEIWGEP